MADIRVTAGVPVVAGSRYNLEERLMRQNFLPPRGRVHMLDGEVKHRTFSRRARPPRKLFPAFDPKEWATAIEPTPIAVGEEQSWRLT